MSRAEYRKVYGKRGSGRFVVSEGVKLGCNFGPYPELATPDDGMFEIVINPGPLFKENNEQPREDPDIRTEETDGRTEGEPGLPPEDGGATDGS